MKWIWELLGKAFEERIIKFKVINFKEFDKICQAIALIMMKFWKSRGVFVLKTIIALRAGSLTLKAVGREESGNWRP